MYSRSQRRFLADTYVHSPDAARSGDCAGSSDPVRPCHRGSAETPVGTRVEVGLLIVQTPLRGLPRMGSQTGNALGKGRSSPGDPKITVKHYCGCSSEERRHGHTGSQGSERTCGDATLMQLNTVLSLHMAARVVLTLHVPLNILRRDCRGHPIHL